MSEKRQLRHTGFFCLHRKKHVRLKLKKNKNMKMSNASVKAASFKKWKCEKEKQVEMRKNKQKKKQRGKNDTDSLYHSNNIIITGDEASRLQVGNISIFVLRWTKFL